MLDRWSCSLITAYAGALSSAHARDAAGSESLMFAAGGSPWPASCKRATVGTGHLYTRRGGGKDRTCSVDECRPRWQRARTRL